MEIRGLCLIVFSFRFHGERNLIQTVFTHCRIISGLSAFEIHMQKCATDDHRAQYTHSQSIEFYIKPKIVLPEQIPK